MAIEAIAATTPAVLIERTPATASGSPASFAQLLDGASAALARADTAAAMLAAGKGNVAEAAIARAKADVVLEVAAIASSRASNAISTLLQTQV